MNAIKQALLALALLALSLGNTSARSAVVGNVTSRGPTGATNTEKGSVPTSQVTGHGRQVGDRG